jgi:hypothetical protein
MKILCVKIKDPSLQAASPTNQGVSSRNLEKLRFALVFLNVRNPGARG